MATATKERPIDMRDWEVRALREGRKTQTRRAVKDVIPWADRWYLDSSGSGKWMPDGPSPTGRGGAAGHWRPCPYGKPGDRLYVREPHVFGYDADEFGNLVMEDEQGNDLPEKVWYRATDEVHWLDEDGGTTDRVPWRSSTQMPRRASRNDIEVVSVRIERVQSITEADALAEGLDVETCGRILRQAAGKARMEFARWLELPDYSEPDGYWCLKCVYREAKKQRARVCGWNDCFDYDHAPRCNECGIMLHHSLTRYGVETELDLTNEESARISYTPKDGDSALALAELAEGMGDWSDDFEGRLAQIGFATEWDRRLKRKGLGWETNPWTWVIEHREARC